MGPFLGHFGAKFFEGGSQIWGSSLGYLSSFWESFSIFEGERLVLGSSNLRDRGGFGVFGQNQALFRKLRCNLRERRPFGPKRAILGQNGFSCSSCFATCGRVARVGQKGPFWPFFRFFGRATAKNRILRFLYPGRPKWSKCSFLIAVRPYWSNYRSVWVFLAFGQKVSERRGFFAVFGPSGQNVKFLISCAHFVLFLGGQSGVFWSFWVKTPCQTDPPKMAKKSGLAPLA